MQLKNMQNSNKFLEKPGGSTKNIKSLTKPNPLLNKGSEASLLQKFENMRGKETKFLSSKKSPRMHASLHQTHDSSFKSNGSPKPKPTVDTNESLPSIRYIIPKRDLQQW